jgi:RNA polymerase sigma-70 factor (ECF subfamily)
MNEERFKRLFLPLHPKLYRIAFALTRNTQDAEDILQDAYCKLWDRRDTLKEIENQEAFCVTLVRNLCFDFLRLAARKRSQEEDSEIAVLNHGSPESTLIEQDEMRVINQIISRLPESQRQVIQLRSIDDCSAEEVEHITGLSAVNVRVLLSRARKTIREQFEKAMNYER